MASIQMKHLICFLLAFVTFDGLNAQVQQSTRPQGDSNFSVWLTSTDTTKAKVFNGFSETLLLKLSESLHFADSLNKLWPKYDTIGPVLRLVSDTGHGWNPASAMWVWEVRKYVNEWITVDPDKGQSDEEAQFTIAGTTPPIYREQQSVPRHLKWLDSNKKPLTLKVWETN